MQTIFQRAARFGSGRCWKTNNPSEVPHKASSAASCKTLLQKVITKPLGSNREQTMKIRSTSRVLPILGCFGILTVTLSGCKDTSIKLPPAETPILETILDIDKHLIAPFHQTG